MPTFRYKARTKQGEIQSGVIEAGSREAALEILRQLRLVIVSLEASERAALLKKLLFFRRRVRPKQLVFLVRQLTVLFAAGVPLVEALRTLHEEAETPALKETLFEIAEDVNGGMPLSNALARHPKSFSTFFIMMARSGEVSGRLQESLAFMADYLEREYELSSSLKRAFMYPGFIFFTFLVVAGLLLTFVVPQLGKIFEETGLKLPFLTRLMIGASHAFRSYGWILLILVVVGGVPGFRYLIGTQKGRSVWDRVKLKIPVFGGLLQKVYIARLTENLGTLLEGGISITQGLEVSAGVVGNVHYRALLLEGLERVKRGEALSVVFFGAPRLIPRAVSAMVAVGERTGKLDTIFRTVARFYQRDVNSMVEGLVDLIEPLMLAVMGGGVGLLVASILLPIYRLASGF